MWSHSANSKATRPCFPWRVHRVVMDHLEVENSFIHIWLTQAHFVVYLRQGLTIVAHADLELKILLSQSPESQLELQC